MRRRRWRMPALVAGGVAFGLSFGNTPAAVADDDDAPPPVKVDFVGDSLVAGEGLHGTYFNANDVRHQSRRAAPAQALARVVAAHPALAVDARVAAASGAVTADFFAPQESGGKVVNTPQLDQVRADADVVVVGFGASDAMTTELVHAAANAEDDTSFDALLTTIEPGLSTLAADVVYREQAASAEPGLAGTLTARLIQVLDAIRAAAPDAEIVVTNYPIVVDPARSAGFAEFSADELSRLREFGQRLNAAIERAARICGCATLADVSGALDGHEVYAEDPAVNDLSAGLGGPAVDHRANEVFQPNLKGAGLIADRIVGVLAGALSVRAPKAGSPAPAEAIALAPAVARVPAEPGAGRDGHRSRGEAGPARQRRHEEPVRRERVPGRDVVREVVAATRPIVRALPVVGAAPPAEPRPAGDVTAPVDEPAVDRRARPVAGLAPVEPVDVAQRRARSVDGLALVESVDVAQRRARSVDGLAPVEPVDVAQRHARSVDGLAPVDVQRGVRSVDGLALVEPVDVVQRRVRSVAGLGQVEDTAVDRRAPVDAGEGERLVGGLLRPAGADGRPVPAEADERLAPVEEAAVDRGERAGDGAVARRYVAPVAGLVRAAESDEVWRREAVERRAPEPSGSTDEAPAGESVVEPAGEELARLLPCAVTEAGVDGMEPCPPVAGQQADEGGPTAAGQEGQ